MELGLFDQFCLSVNLEADLASDCHASPVEGSIPGHAPSMAVDHRLGMEERLQPPPIDREPEKPHVERDRVCLTANRQVARQLP